jgi:hypothetical protein
LVDAQAVNTTVQAIKAIFVAARLTDEKIGTE